jgi:hypothetical protein
VKKTKQLGMPIGTATHQLRKQILFSLVMRCGLDICFQCGMRITRVEDLSIEHKVPWLDSDDPVRLFFDLSNISFSHLRCNVSAGRRSNQKYFTDIDRKTAERRLDTLLKHRKYDSDTRRNKYLRTGN